jgi:hypothetical protein
MAIKYKTIIKNQTLFGFGSDEDEEEQDKEEE